MKNLKSMDVALLVLRLFAGLTLLYFGSQKMLGVFGGKGIHPDDRDVRAEHGHSPSLRCLRDLRRVLWSTGLGVRFLDARRGFRNHVDDAGRFVPTRQGPRPDGSREGNPYQPLDPEAQAFMQLRADDYYAAFTKGVATSRAVGIDRGRKRMGQGRVLGAEAALSEKMVDGILTFDDAVKKMQKDLRATAPAAANPARRAENELMILGY